MCKKIFDSKFILLLIIMPFFNPVSLKYTPGLNYLYDIIQIFKVISIALLIFCFIKNNFISKNFILVFSIIFFFLGSALINKNIDRNFFAQIYLMFGWMILFYLSYKYNFYNFNKVLFFYLTFLEIINLILTIIYPNGLPFATNYNFAGNSLYFLAIDNGMFRQLLPLCFSASFLLSYKINANYKFSKLLPYVIVLLTCFFNIVLIKSATGFVSCLLMLILLSYSLIVKRNLNSTLFLSLIGLFFILIVVVGENITIVNFIAKILNRNPNFTGRNLLWHQGIQQIIAKPLFGYGNVTNTINIWNNHYSTHNMFLELFINIGIVGFLYFIFLTIFGLVYKKKSYSYLYNTCLIFIFVLFINGFMESGVSNIFYGMLVVLLELKPKLINKNRSFARNPQIKSNF